jgi:hypothetical protein
MDFLDKSSSEQKYYIEELRQIYNELYVKRIVELIENKHFRKYLEKKNYDGFALISQLVSHNSFDMMIVLSHRINDILMKFDQRFSKIAALSNGVFCATPSNYQVLPIVEWSDIDREYSQTCLFDFQA